MAGPVGQTKRRGRERSDTAELAARDSRSDSDATSRSPIAVRRMGRVGYADAVELQRDLVARRRAGEIPDQLLLLEHPHVITKGSSARSDHVLLDAAERRLMGIDLFESGRGGDVTYHGPGQLVGYPILALEEERRDLHRYIRDLELVLIRTLAKFDVDARRREGLTGVWVGDEKIAAIGVRVSSGWITSHGFALNVTTNLDYFRAIVPCGIRAHSVTSMERVLGRAPDVDSVMDAAERSFEEVFA